MATVIYIVPNAINTDIETWKQHKKLLVATLLLFSGTAVALQSNLLLDQAARGGNPSGGALE